MSMNERYVQPAMPEGVEEGIIKGLYLFSKNKDAKVQLMGSGAILNEVIAAKELLEKDFSIAANVWSATSFNELRREASLLEREARFAPTKKIPLSYLEECLQDQNGPVIAATDYVRAYAEQIRPWVKSSYTVLGTDGYGRSDTRARLREFFEVDRYHIVLATLHTLAKEGTIPMSEVTKAIKKYKMDPNKPNPMTA